MQEWNIRSQHLRIVATFFLRSSQCFCFLGCKNIVVCILSFLQLRLWDQKLSITASHLKNLCELIEPCSPDMKFYFNIQITLLS